MTVSFMVTLTKCKCSLLLQRTPLKISSKSWASPSHHLQPSSDSVVSHSSYVAVKAKKDNVLHRRKSSFSFVCFNQTGGLRLSRFFATSAPANLIIVGARSGALASFLNTAPVSFYLRCVRTRLISLTNIEKAGSAMTMTVEFEDAGNQQPWRLHPCAPDTAEPDRQ